MIDIIPTGETLGATIAGVDLNETLNDRVFGDVLRALGRYGVLRFPNQTLDPARPCPPTSRRRITAIS